MNITDYWNAVLRQDADSIRRFFSPDARINWHCTNESFTVEEFIRANCEYPGQWDGVIERIERTGDLIITAVRVFSKDGSASGSTQSFHAVSFIRTRNGKITAVDEYWGDDAPAPEWRSELNIGKPIKTEKPS